MGNIQTGFSQIIINSKDNTEKIAHSAQYILFFITKQISFLA